MGDCNPSSELSPAGGGNRAKGSLKGLVIEFVHRDRAGHLVPPQRRIPLEHLMVRFERRPNVPLIDPALIRHHEAEASAAA